MAQAEHVAGKRGRLLEDRVDGADARHATPGGRSHHPADELSPAERDTDAQALDQHVGGQLVGEGAGEGNGQRDFDAYRRAQSARRTKS